MNASATLFRAVRHATHRESLQRAARRDVDFATSTATANDVELDLFRRDNAAAELLRVFWQSPLACSARLSQAQGQRLLQACWRSAATRLCAGRCAP